MTNRMFTIAIQYPGFGPQHPPRLQAIVDESPTDNVRVVAMEMFSKDSDYEWNPVIVGNTKYERHTVMQCSSDEGRSSQRQLREAVRQSLDEIQPDVLIVNGWGHRESRASLAWARANKCRTVLLSDSVRENMQRTWWKEAYKKFLVRNCDSAFVAGSPQARYVKRLGIQEEKIFHPGSCSVDNDYWMRETSSCRQRKELLRQQYGLPRNYFLCVARFIDVKNLPFLIKAYAKFRKSTPQTDWELVLCGSGPEEKKLRQIVDSLKVPGVNFTGFRQADELPVYYALASVFVLPSSIVECWGLVVNEAMACGLPVLVSHRVGSAEDLVIDGVNGFRFDPFNQDQLTELMTRLSSDEKQRQKMGQESSRIIDSHSCSAAARNLWKAVAAARAA